MLNSVSLTGRLTRDVELRYTQGGTAVGSFTLAVDRQFTNGQGQREADFINCVIWRKSAENLTNFTRKGSLIGITGRMQTRSYDNKDGQRVYVTEVVVDNFALLERKGTQASPEAENKPQTAPNVSSGTTYNQQPKTPQTAPQAEPTKPVAQAPTWQTNTAYQQQATSDQFKDNGKEIDISDDDLPF